jgi:hypothetical protein
MKSGNDTKTGFFKAIILSIAITLGGNIVSAGNIIVDKGAPGPGMLKVKVKPTADGMPQSGVSIKLYRVNDLVQSIETKKYATMLELKKNQNYIIEISKPGFITRKVSISTHLSDEIDLRPIFRYDMEVMLEKEVAGVTPDYFNVPIAVISYHKVLDRFIYDKNYTAHIKYEQEKAISRATSEKI